ncbi:MAG: DUF5333 domain-containing protein [Alphaproteobacteria bacterium]|nr:DUF5333 domain-containing protein [Alphaproteobacteria bacterium]
MTLKTTLSALALVAATSLSAEARVPLQDDKTIDDGLTLVAIGNYLRKQCDAVTPRYWKTYTFMRSLQARARDLGYSDDEIEDYLEDDTEKDRVKARARAYLVARGADFDAPDTFCTVGRAEIENDTSVGRFLKVR